MKREEFKAEDLDKELENKDVVEDEIVDDVIVDDDTDTTGEPGETEEKPFWLSDDEADDDIEDGQTVPLAVLLKEKNKRKDKVAELEQKIAELEKGIQPTVQPVPVKRPRITDFNSDAEYEEAMDKWEESFGNTIVQTVTSKQTHNQADQRIHQEVEKFYTNAEKLVKDHAIAPDVYVAASRNVIDSLDHISPGKGQALFHALVATVGDHAEKIVFHVGRNKAALAEFQSQLLADPSGSRALVYLGSLKAKVSGNNKKSSRAPAPAAQIPNGDTGGKAGVNEKRKFDDLVKKGKLQDAFNVKKAAKNAGIDTKKW